MSLVPVIEGSVSIQSPADRFLSAFRQRVAAGLLTGRPHPRSNYVIADAGPDRIEIRADDWWTAANVGLNTVQLRHLHPNTIRYRIQYWRWAQFVLGLSAALGLIGLVLLLSFDVRGYIAEHLSSMIPGLSIDQNVLIAWLMVLFWGFIWPWLLIWFHKRPLHGLIKRLIAEVDATNVPAAQR
jgi:hypothetical protein